MLTTVYVDTVILQRDVGAISDLRACASDARFDYPHDKGVCLAYTSRLSEATPECQMRQVRQVRQVRQSAARRKDKFTIRNAEGSRAAGRETVLPIFKR